MALQPFSLVLVSSEGGDPVVRVLVPLDDGRVVEQDGSGEVRASGWSYSTVSGQPLFTNGSTSIFYAGQGSSGRVVQGDGATVEMVDTGVWYARQSTDNSGFGVWLVAGLLAWIIVRDSVWRYSVQA